MTTRKVVGLLALWALALAACIPPGGPEPTTRRDPASTPTPPASPLPSTPALSTPLDPIDGNLWTPGRGQLPQSRPIDLPLSGIPLWVSGTAAGSGSLWAVALTDGRVQTFRLHGAQATEITSNLPTLPAGMPPTWRPDGKGNPSLLHPHPDDGPLAPPIPLAGGRTLTLGPDGTLRLRGADHALIHALDVDALPDARLRHDGGPNLLVYSDPTDRYPHGVLGDRLEAGSITLVEILDDRLTLTRRIPLPDGKVAEGIAPLWIDMDADGQRDIVVTWSYARQGAQVAVLRADGSLLAAGPSIGQGFRWRHVLAAGPLGPRGERELVEVRTPHLNGVVNFYRLAGHELQIAASQAGFTSHVLGSRNLEMAAAGDFDGDGRGEVLVLTPDRTALAAIGRVEGGAEVRWQIPVGGTLSTNLAAVSTAEGVIVVGAGRSDGVLRLWPAGS